jgi:aminoglycoside phosphotransferase (APT) family kinase protein
VDTAPIRPEERFDEESVAAYLRQALPELLGDAPIEFEQFPGGAANLTYLVRAGDLELVLRRPPLGPVAPGAHDMSREYRVLSRLWEEFRLAPRAYHHCEDPAVIGKDFFVMERRRGHVIRRQWPSGFDDGARLRLGNGLVDALVDLHRVDPAGVGFEDLGRPAGFVERQVAGWSRRWSAAATRPVPAMDELSTRLAAEVPEPQAAVILHNDFKLDNTMTDTDGNLVAVFDWDMATLGDPLVDLGTMLAYWADPDDPTFLIFGSQAVTLAPHMAKGDVVARYAERSGLDVTSIAYYEALALWRIATIIEQIYARFVAGQTSDDRFAGFEPIAPLLADAALVKLTG